MKVSVRIVTKSHISPQVRLPKGNMEDEGLIRRLRRQQLINKKA